MIDIDIDIDIHQELNFNFEKYTRLIISVIPYTHLVYLKKIKYVDSYNKRLGCDLDGLGCYYFFGKEGVILLNIKNILKYKIPAYLFNYYAEVAALYLSEIIGHEIGHHVATFWKHSIKNQEKYASKYAKCCYLNYFESRKNRIIITLFLGEINIFDFSKKDRELFRESRKELLLWSKSKAGDPTEYPCSYP